MKSLPPTDHRIFYTPLQALAWKDEMIYGAAGR
jgi:hypothetical protein